MKKRPQEQSWYPYTIAACSAVALYVLLTNLGVIGKSLSTLGGYFAPVVLGCVIAYVINPIAKILSKTLFAGIRNENTQWSVSSMCSLLLVAIVLVLLFGMIVPQLFHSIQTFANNLDGYVATLDGLMADINLTNLEPVQELIQSSSGILEMVTRFLTDNLSRILSTSANIGKSFANLMVAVILSIYLLAGKRNVKAGVGRFLHAVVPEKMLAEIWNVLERCDVILSRYISYSLLESMIVGSANAIFMQVAGMQYIGLVSVVVGLFNLIPTFGPVIGGAIGAFILVLVKPSHAIIFIIFTCILQTIDGYIIKPRLFGNTLGVSGLLILISVIVCGRIFGVIGILLAIPIAAILDFLYKELLLPGLEKRKARREAENKA